MARAVDEIKAEYGLTDFAAKEILEASNKLSKSYEALASAYRTNLLTESKELASRVEYHEYNKRSASIFKKAAHAIDRLSGDAKKMWSAYGDAVKAQNHFVAVCKAHQLPSSWDRVITRSFEIRKATHDFTMGGETVVTGRDAFDTLSRERRSLLNTLSVGKFIKDIPHVER